MIMIISEYTGIMIIRKGKLDQSIIKIKYRNRQQEVHKDKGIIIKMIMKIIDLNGWITKIIRYEQKNKNKNKNRKIKIKKN